MRLKTYLNNFKTNDSNITHLSFDKCKYNIPNEKLKEFYDIYYNTIKENKEKTFLIEKINNSDNFSFFLDIEVPKSDKEYNIGCSDINFIINQVKKLSEKFFSEKVDTEYIISKRKVDKMSKFHVNFPNIIVNSEIAICFIKEFISVLSKHEKRNYLKNYIDTSVYKTGLRMLGSKKNEESKPNVEDIYSIVKIDVEEKEDNKVFKFSSVELTFDIFLKTIIQTDSPVISVKKEFQEIHKNNTVNKNSINDDVIANEIKMLISDIRINLNDTDYVLPEQIGKILAKQHANGLYYFYITILDVTRRSDTCNQKVFCPFKQRRHTRDSSPIYLEMSMKGIHVKCFDTDCKFKKFPDEPVKLPGIDDYGDDTKFRTRFPNLYLSMNTKYWKSEINLDDRPDLKFLLEDSLSCSHYKIAKAAFNIYKDRFRVDDIKNTNWYEYNGTIWHKSYAMNILISEDLKKYYKAIKISVTSNANLNGDLKDLLVNEEEEVKRSIRNELVDSIINKLENVTFKKNILSEMIYLFKSYEPNFMSKLDGNPYLIGFDDCVYDLRSKSVRKGLITDYITFTTGYNYVEYNNTDEIFQEIYIFLRQIIPNPNVFEYLMKKLGRSLLGISDEHFYIFTGLSGANGKSTLINLLERTLGDYATAVDVSLLTNKRGLSSNASPDVMRIKGKRIIDFQEPESDDVLRTGLIKSFSGGDTIIARNLFQSPISFKIQASMIMCCNDIPKINSIDGGITRRLRVIDFKSRFCDNPKKENEYKIDPLIKEKIEEWKSYFMAILIHYFNIHEDELKTTGKISEPIEVMKSTEKFKEDNDVFDDFITECVEDDLTSFVNESTVYNCFVEWWEINNPNNKFKIPDKKALLKSLKIKFGEENYIIQNKKKGFRLKLLNEDAIEED